MSRFSRIIDQLEDLDQQDLKNYQDDIKNSSKVFSITAQLYERLQELAESSQSKSKTALPSQKITKEFLLKRFGSYDTAYRTYQKAYGIKCRKGWKNFVPLIQELKVPTTTEERLEALEEKVNLLAEILLSAVKQEL